jgi:hypothetical protein
MGRTTRSWALLLLAALCLPAIAHAQASRFGATYSLGGSTAPVERPDIAHDYVNNRYLLVAGKGFIEGQLLNAAGQRMSAFRVNALPEYAQNPRVAFGGDRYLVTWHAVLEPGPYARVRGRILDANGTPLTGDFDIAVTAVNAATSSCWLDGADVAYSTGSQEFLVAWSGYFFHTRDIFFQRVNVGGALLGGNTLLSLGDAVRQDREPAVAYNPHRNEFFVAYGVWDDSSARGYVSGRPVVAGSGEMVGPAPPLPQFGSAAAGMKVPSISYNTTTQQYLLGWTQLSPFQHVNSVTLTGTGVQTGPLRVLSSFYAAYDALDIDYNQPSGKFLLVTHGAGTQPWEDAAVSINPDGTAYDNGFFLTSTTDVRALRSNPAANDGNFHPRIAPSAHEGKWLMVTSSVFAAVHAQFASSGASQPPPPPTTNPNMSVDYPPPGTTVAGMFAVGGWAIDAGSPTGTGVSAVHVWARPHSGASPIFLGGATLGLPRPDVGAAFGDGRFTASGFALSGLLPPGPYDIDVSAFSTVTASFNIMRRTTVNVVQPASLPAMYIDLPGVGQTVPQNFPVAGWAVDLASASGHGVDAVHVYAYPVGGGSPIFVGPATVGYLRPDVAAHFGAARFAPAGFGMVATLPPGDYDLAVFAQSYIVGAFNNVATIRIRVV